MDRIEELYREKDKLERALLIMLIFPLPGIGIGLLIQIKKIEREIRKLTLEYKRQALLVILPEDKKEEKTA